MIYLPEDLNVSVKKISSCFNNTSASYKFYWVISLLDAVSEQKEKISKKEIFCRMIANAWYTINYFHLSFGKQDKLEEAIQQLKIIENLDVDTKQENVFNTLFNSINKDTLAILNHFDSNVPHKFLSPWLGSSSQRNIYLMSQTLSH